MDIEAAFNTPHIIETLFQNLAALDLCRCACVSKLWNHLATIELSKRKKTVYFYQGLKCSFHKRGHRTLKECTMKTAGKFEEELDQLIRNLEVKPAFCIAFATVSFIEKFEFLFPSHPISKPKSKKFKMEFDDTSRKRFLESVLKTALKKRLPTDCQVGLYVEKNIIDMNSRPDHVLVGDLSLPAISGYFFSALPEQGIKFCSKNNHGREVFKTISTQNDIKSALFLIEHKAITYFALGLGQIQNKFNAFQNCIVLPVQYGSSAIPLFFGPNVETVCINIPFSNDKECEIAKKMEQQGAIAFMFGHRSCPVTWKDFHDYLPQIPIVGLWGFDPYEKYESTKESEFYRKLIDKHLNLNFKCKCVLISIKY